MDAVAETTGTPRLADGRPLVARSECVRGMRAAAALSRHETTIARSVSLQGVGLHGGIPVRVVLKPAGTGCGIVFHRVDLGPSARIPARHDLVADTRLCTLLADPVSPDVHVGTVEHLMAAIAAHGLDNLLVEIDGPEVPILDGSARPFVSILAVAGRVDLDRGATAIAVRRPVRVEDGEAFASLLPSNAFSLDLSIDFDAPAIGRQSILLDPLTEQSFAAELADARTFTLLSEIDKLREAGLAQGGSLANAVVVDGGRVLNPSGLRMRDEFVRHKALDAVGDLRLAGCPILGRYVAHRAGHGLNNRVLRALFADDANWDRVPVGAELPGRRGGRVRNAA